MKGDPPATVTCPLCGASVTGTPHRRKYTGTVSTRIAVRGAIQDHLILRHILLNARERSEIADRVCTTLEAFA